MKKIQQLFFPKPDNKIFKGFGPAFLVIALGIGSGEFILWPYLSAHYGFGILWGALLGVILQLIIVVALERHTAFLGVDALTNFQRVWKRSFWWILISTLTCFGWPGFSAMASQLLIQGLDLPISELSLSIFMLIVVSLLLLLGKSAYKNILLMQKINMGLLLGLVVFLFIYYFDLEILGRMFQGFFGIGESYFFIPAGLSLVTFMGAVAYAGSGGNLMIMNSFYVEKEKKGLVTSNTGETFLEPNNNKESIENAKAFSKLSWKQNSLFFFGGGILLIILLSYISYAVLYGQGSLPEDFTFLVRESHVFSKTIHPIVGKLFIISGFFALLGVQVGIFDFIGRIAANKPGILNDSKKQRIFYRRAIIGMLVFGLSVLMLGLTQPNTLIIIGATLNAFSMGVLSYLLFRVESRILPSYIQSVFFKRSLIFASLFYGIFFIYVVLDRFFL